MLYFQRVQLIFASYCKGIKNRVMIQKKSISTRCALIDSYRIKVRDYLITAA